MRISDWSSDVCSSDLTHRVPRSCGAVPEGHVARRIALGASRGTWRKLQEHLLQVWRHQRFADRLEAVLPAPELDACIVAWQAQPDRRCPRLVPAPAQRGVEQGELGLRVAVPGLGMQPPQVPLPAVAHLVARDGEDAQPGIGFVRAPGLADRPGGTGTDVAGTEIGTG